MQRDRGRAARWLAGATSGVLAVVTVLAVVEVAAWLAAGTAWPELVEIQGLAMVWLGLLGAAWGVESGFHLGVTLVVDRLPPRWRRGAARLAAALVALFGVLLAWQGTALVRVVSNTLPATGWPAAWQYVPAVVAGVLLAWSGTRRALDPEALREVGEASLAGPEALRSG